MRACCRRFGEARSFPFHCRRFGSSPLEHGSSHFSGLGSVFSVSHYVDIFSSNSARSYNALHALLSHMPNPVVWNSPSSSFSFSTLCATVHKGDNRFSRLRSGSFAIRQLDRLRRRRRSGFICHARKARRTKQHYVPEQRRAESYVHENGYHGCLPR